MSILSVDNISPIGSGTSVTVNSAATLVVNNVSVAGVSTFTGNVIVDSGTVRCNDGFSSDVDLIFNADANNNGTGSIIFKESGSETVRIDSSGRVLIGTTTEGFAEADDLTINSADHGGITIRTPTNKEGNIAFSDTTSGTGEYSGLIRYRHNNDDLGLWTNSLLRLLINSSGYVMIGTTIEGNIAADNLTVAGSGDEGITIRSGTSNSGNLFFSDGTSGGDEYRGYLQYQHSSNNLSIGTNATTRLSIDSSGNATITDGDLILANGHGIDFSATANAGNSASMGSERLDDYEEGSWTPHLVSSAGNMSTTSFSLHQGTYTKIGRLVYITGVMYGPRSSGGTGNLRISNLPFTVRNGDHTQLLTKDYQLSNYPTNFGHISGYGMNNNTQIQLFKREGSSQAGLPLSWWSTSANDYMYFNLTYTTDT